MRMVGRILAGESFAALTAVQEGVVAVRQLTALGLDRRAIRRRIGSEWQSIGSHVVVLHTGPLARRQQWWAGVLHAGAGAALGGTSALEADGLSGFESDLVHVVAPHGTARRSLEVSDVVRIRVHESRGTGADVLALRRPPRTMPARSAVDAAAWSGSDGRCRAVLAASVQQQLVWPADLRAVAYARPTLTRRSLILETVDDLEGGSQSVPELAWVVGLRRFGLPEPTRQAKVRNARGWYFLDARFDPWRVAVEINGIQHLELRAREADDERRLALAAGGLLVVDLSSYLVRHEIGVAMLRTARALYARGWQPEPRTVALLQRVAAQRREPLWLPAAA